MKKIKQILALIGVVFLISLYGLTLASAIMDNPNSMNYFAASVLATVIIPALLWAYSFIYRLLSGKNSQTRKDVSANQAGKEPAAPDSDEDTAENS